MTDKQDPNDPTAGLTQEEIFAAFDRRAGRRARSTGRKAKPSTPNYVTVEQLIKTLLKMPPDAQVVLASDGEGNHFEILGRVTKGNYRERDIETDDPEDNDFHDDEWYAKGEEHRPINAVCLWPVG